MASLPGGEIVEDYTGYTEYTTLGWKEVELLSEMLHLIEYKDDVAVIVEEILRLDGAFDEEEE